MGVVDRKLKVLSFLNEIKRHPNTRVNPPQKNREERRYFQKHLNKNSKEKS